MVKEKISFYAYIEQADEIDMIRIKMKKIKYQLRYEHRLN